MTTKWIISQSAIIGCIWTEYDDFNNYVARVVIYDYQTDSWVGDYGPGEFTPVTIVPSFWVVAI